MTPEARILRFTKLEAARLGLRPVRLAFRAGVEGGWPDLMVLGPGGRVLFIETKRRGRSLAPLQEERRREIVEEYGHRYERVDSPERACQVLQDFADGE